MHLPLAPAANAGFPRWPVRLSTLLLCMAVVSGLTALPYALHTLSPKYHGLIVMRDKDYANYYSRLERSLSGYPEEAENGITPVGSGIRGVQTAWMEHMLGMLFAWTGLSAPALSIGFTAVFTPFLFLLLFLLFCTIGLPGRTALAMTGGLFMIMFHGFSRVMHPGWSFVPTIAALLGTVIWARTQKRSMLLCAAILLGILPSIYFWHWTWSWATVAAFFGILACAHGRAFWQRRRTLDLLLALCLTLALSFPFALRTAMLIRDSRYPEVSIRASFLEQRYPESPTRSVLILIMLMALLTGWRRHKMTLQYSAPLALMLGVTIALHQNIVHAKVLMFASHYEPHMLIAAIAAFAALQLLPFPTIARWCGSAAAVLLLAGGMYDYAFAHRFFTPEPIDFRDQHLAPAIRFFDNGVLDTVLTDATTGRILTAFTPDGILYTTHSRFLFISDALLAEHYCMSQLFKENPPSERVLYNEYNRVLWSSAMQERQRRLVGEACKRVQSDPLGHMRQYGVDYILWNQKQEPDWHVDTKVLPLEEVASGSGWTIWRLRG